MLGVDLDPLGELDCCPADDDAVLDGRYAARKPETSTITFARPYT